MAAPKRPGVKKRKLTPRSPGARKPEPKPYVLAPVDADEPLRNPQHETFAQCIASGMPVRDAYLEAGFQLGSNGSYGNARKLNSLRNVRLRVASIQKQRASTLTKAFQAKADTLKITRERILEEYAAIAFSRITQIVTFGGGRVSVENSEDLDDATVAAISEVSQTRDGIKVKLYDKPGALAALSKLMGFTTGEGTSTDPALNPEGGTLEITDERRAIALLALIERVKRTRIAIPSQ